MRGGAGAARAAEDSLSLSSPRLFQDPERIKQCLVFCPNSNTAAMLAMLPLRFSLM